MSSPIVIHVLRPYASEEEYLAHESFSINARSMLLIGEQSLPAETPIIFDISLSNGQKPIRAEGKVIEYVAPVGDRAGGLRVRFKRFGAVTKAFIDRAVARSPAPPSIVPGPRSTSPSIAPESRKAPSIAPESRKAPSIAPESRKAPSIAPESRKAPSIAPESRKAPSIAPESRKAPSVAPESRKAQSVAPEAPASAESAVLEGETKESSGIHRKTVQPVVAPPNRNALLERLRARRSG